MKDGHCPSCTKDMSAALPPVTKVSIWPDTRFPKMCCTCGMSTTDAEIIEMRGGDGLSDGEKTIFMIILGFFFWPLLFALKRDHLRSESKAVFRIPRCLICQDADGDLRPEFFHAEEERLVLLVDRSFADAMNRA